MKTDSYKGLMKLESALWVTFKVRGMHTLQAPLSLRMGDLTRKSGLSSRTVRYYEQIGLIKPLGRTSGGYRLFHPDALERLSFIRQAQSFGLSLEAIRSLLGAHHKDDPRCTEARSQLSGKLTELEEMARRIQQQMASIQALQEACERCVGDCLLKDVVLKEGPSGGMS